MTRLVGAFLVLLFSLLLFCFSILTCFNKQIDSFVHMVSVYCITHFNKSKGKGLIKFQNNT